MKCLVCGKIVGEADEVGAQKLHAHECECVGKKTDLPVILRPSATVKQKPPESFFTIEEYYPGYGEYPQLNHSFH